MNPSEKIDEYITKYPDWRGAKLAEIRKAILAVNPKIIEEWKWMGSPVWELDGIICLGNIYKTKVQIVFHNGASLSDPDKVFNAGLTGNKWRAIDIFEGNQIAEVPFKNLIRAAIDYNQSKKKK